MTDKLQKIRENVEKLKSQLIRGACASQIAMETRCKEEAYNEVLSILDTTQEEPVSKDYRERYKRIAESEEFRKNYDGMSIGDIVPVKEQEPVSEDLEKIVEEIAEPTILNAYGTKELARRLRNTICGTSVSEDLGEYINELSKQFPEVSFAKLSRIAVRVSRWQKTQDTKNKLPKVTDRTELDEYAYQCAYDMSNDWAIDNPTWHDVEDACKLGAKWQKQQDQSTIELAEDHAMLAGMEKMKEQMMAKAIDVEVKVDAGGYPYIPQMELYDYDKDIPLAKEGDKYKVVLIKE